MQTPIYSSDAVRNFAIHAKVYAEHRSLAPDALNAIRVGGHREYPPVVALNEALLFQAAADTRYAKPFFALAYLAFLLLVVEAVARRLRPAFAVPLGVLFLCLPQAAYAGGNAMADLPLTACFLLLGLELRSILAWPSAAGVLRIGLLAGLAASIKNEGLAVGALALIALGLWGLRGARLSRASLAGGAAIAVLLVAPWQAFKRAHGISERYLAHAVDQNPLENIDRVLPIARKFASVAFQPEQVGAPAPAFHGWLALAVLAYVALHRDRWRRTLPFLLALGVHVGLYAAVFLVTPRAFEWHIASASERLLLHTLPWLLLLCAAALGGPAAAPARPLRSQ